MILSRSAEGLLPVVAVDTTENKRSRAASLCGVLDGADLFGSLG